MSSKTIGLITVHPHKLLPLNFVHLFSMLHDDIYCEAQFNDSYRPITGFTEWLAVTERKKLSLSWDWQVTSEVGARSYKVIGEPFANFQLYNPLDSAQSIRSLIIDPLPWQSVVDGSVEYFYD